MLTKFCVTLCRHLGVSELIVPMHDQKMGQHVEITICVICLMLDINSFHTALLEINNIYIREWYWWVCANILELTHCGLEMSYGDINLGQHWLS